MLHNFEIYFLLFISYSFLGWLMETVTKFVQYKRFINRGFLIGPYLPIYGFGSLFIILLLEKYKNDIFAIFMLSIVICSILEYFTSYVMEKIFCARWWDYSNKKYNVNGRICIDTMIPFGLLCVILIKIVNPFLRSIFNLFSKKNLHIIALIVLILLLTDLVISSIILISIRKENKKLSGDCTEKMSKKVYNEVMKLGWAYKRLFKAFPNVYNIGELIKSGRKKTIKFIKKKRIKKHRINDRKE